MDKKRVLILALFLVLLGFFEFLFLKTNYNRQAQGPLETFKNYHNALSSCSNFKELFTIGNKYSAKIEPSELKKYQLMIKSLPDPLPEGSLAEYHMELVKLLAKLGYFLPYSRMKIEDSTITDDWARITYADKKYPTAGTGQTILVKIGGTWKIENDVGIPIKDRKRLKELEELDYRFH